MTGKQTKDCAKDKLGCQFNWLFATTICIYNLYCIFRQNVGVSTFFRLLNRFSNGLVQHTLGIPSRVSRLYKYPITFWVPCVKGVRRIFILEFYVRTVQDKEGYEVNDRFTFGFVEVEQTSFFERQVKKLNGLIR